MNQTVAGYASTNPDFNCSYADVTTLVRKLGELGLLVTEVVALPQVPDIGPKTYKELIAAGLDPVNDRLFWNIKVLGNDAYQTAAELVVDIAPGNFLAVWKIMSDLFPGVQAQVLAVQALGKLPIGGLQ